MTAIENMDIIDHIYVERRKSMHLPFTVDQFLHIFEVYNQAIWPLQIICYLAGLFMIFTLFKPNALFDRINNGILSFFWLLMGIGYHWAFFSNINKAAYLFGLLFIIQGLLLLISGVFKNRVSFGFQKFDLYTAFGWLIILYAMLIYPSLGFLYGHVFPSSPVFGVAPCPTTIFTFGIFLLTINRIPKHLLIIPLFWSFLGFTAATSLGVKEDFGLLIAGVFTTGLLLARDKGDKRFQHNVSD